MRFMIKGVPCDKAVPSFSREVANIGCSVDILPGSGPDN